VYSFEVFHLGPERYRVVVDGAVLDLRVEIVTKFERRLHYRNRTHRVIAHRHGSLFQVETDGVPHRIQRDDGGLVRAAGPALVIAINVGPGQDVAAGDPLLVLESMKMETVVTAPVAGRIAGVEVGRNVQVEAGAPLLRIQTEAGATQPGAGADRIDFATTHGAADERAERGVAQVFSGLEHHFLGYDLDAGSVAALIGDQRRLYAVLPAGDPALAEAESRLLDLYSGIAGLTAREPEELEEPEARHVRSAQEHLLTYLTFLDAERSGVPSGFLRRLEQALSWYGIDSLVRGPELEEAVFWMYRSSQRLGELTAVVRPCSSGGWPSTTPSRRTAAPSCVPGSTG
jgi:biotin carboxyl carrier protein